MKYVLIVLALVLMAYMVMDFNSRTAELNRLTAEREAIEARLQSKEATKSALKAQIVYATSESAVFEWAYQNHMARPGDHVIVPVQPAQSTPVPTPRPVQTPTQVSNFERWLSLFVDPATP